MNSYIINEIKHQKLVAVTGGAGSGKTTFTKSIPEFEGISVYSLDYSFIGDGEYRKHLLLNKSHSFDEYLDAINQMNWWDWDQIRNNIADLSSGKSVKFQAYDRDTGAYKTINIYPGKTIVIEGAVLHYSLCESADLIIYKHSDYETRFNRLREKDRTRRTLPELISRWLINIYSETLASKIMFEKFRDKIIVIDDNYEIIHDFVFEQEQTYIPYPINI